jgi:hypothetical protein
LAKPFISMPFLSFNLYRQDYHYYIFHRQGKIEVRTLSRIEGDVNNDAMEVIGDGKTY